MSTQNEQPVVGWLEGIIDRLNDISVSQIAVVNFAVVDAIDAITDEMRARLGAGAAAVKLPESAADERDSVRSSAWVGEAPPATHDSEGWWWVADPKTRHGIPCPALVTMGDGELIVHLWEAPYSHYLSQYRGRLRWGRRLAVNGASPTDESSDAMEGNK